MLTTSLRTQYTTYPTQNSRNNAATHSATEKLTSDGRNPTTLDSAGYTPWAYTCSAQSGYFRAYEVAASATMPNGTNSIRLSKNFRMPRFGSSVSIG